MNLLELMLKEEVEWPVGAEFAAQDSDDSSVYFYVAPPAKSDLSDKYWITKEVSHVGRKNLSSLGDDWSTRVITREEYQAAGGWMKWEGGMRPVGDWMMVEIALLGGGGEGFKIPSKALCWDNSGSSSDIVRYRIANQEQAMRSTTKGENVENNSFAATAKQAKPYGQGNPILGMVLADLTNRALEGKEKYGEPLKAHNGRNALWDAYQEALDLAMYLRQLIQEQAE